MHGHLNVRIVDDGQRNCPKHVEFYSKNKFDKLVHLVGFVIRNCRDPRSPERQIIDWIYLISQNIKARITRTLVLKPEVVATDERNLTSCLMGFLFFTAFNTLNGADCYRYPDLV